MPAKGVQASSPTCLTLRRTVKGASECFGKRARELGNLYASRTSLSLKSVFKNSSKAAWVAFCKHIQSSKPPLFKKLYIRLNVWFFSGYEAACHGTKVCSGPQNISNKTSYHRSLWDQAMVQMKRFINKTRTSLYITKCQNIFKGNISSLKWSCGFLSVVPKQALSGTPECWIAFWR